MNSHIEDKMNDQWLNARGKKILPKSERNRRNLLMALQDNSGEAWEGETGDLWLDARGKKTFQFGKSILFMT